MFIKFYCDRRKSILIFALVVICLCGCTKMSEFVQDDAIGMNGSFEIVQSGIPVNWLLYTPKVVPKGDFDVIVDTTEFKDGMQSLKFEVRYCVPSRGWHAPGLACEYKAIAGEKYYISFWIKNQGSTFVADIGGVSAKTGEFQNIITTSQSTEGWKKIEYQYTMPLHKNNKRLRFELNIIKPGTFWIDDIVIKDKNGNTVVPASL